MDDDNRMNDENPVSNGNQTDNRNLGNGGNPINVGNQVNREDQPAHTLYGDYPPKIAEDEIKPMDESGEIVLSRVVVPEYVVSHDGAPSDSTAEDYYVRYRVILKM